MGKQKTYYLAGELADKIRVNVMTIYRYIDAGKIKALKLGKGYRIGAEEVERFIVSIKTKRPKTRRRKVTTEDSLVFERVMQKDGEGRLIYVPFHNLLQITTSTPTYGRKTYLTKRQVATLVRWLQKSL